MEGRTEHGQRGGKERPEEDSKEGERELRAEVVSWTDLASRPSLAPPCPIPVRGTGPYLEQTLSSEDRVEEHA